MSSPRPSAEANVLLVRADWYYIFTLVAAVFIAYQPAWHGGLVWDDDEHIIPAALRTVHGLVEMWITPGTTQQYYPLLYTVSWLEYPWFGANPTGYHLVTIGLHASNAIILWLCLRELRIPGARLAAAIFALHPVMVESVAWITEIKNTLSGVFFFSSTFFFLRYVSTRRALCYGLALGLFTLAVLSKTTTAVLPGVLILIAWWQKGKIDWKCELKPLLPFLAIGLADGLLVTWVEWNFLGAHGATFSLSIVQRVLLATHSIWFYLSKLIWPVDLNFVYPRWTIDASDWKQYTYTAMTAVSLVAIWIGQKRSRSAAALALYFLGTLLPVMGLLNLYMFVYSFVADHLQYLPSVGVFVAAAAAFTQVSRRTPAIARVGGMGILVVLGILTWSQSRNYRNAETLYRATLEKNPNAWLARVQLAALFTATGDDSGAVAELERTLKNPPEYSKRDYAGILNDLGNSYVRLGRLREAVDTYRKAKVIDPKLYGLRINLAGTLLRADRGDEAIEEYEALTLERPTDVRVRAALAVAFASLHRFAEAEREYRTAIALDPTEAMVRYDLASLLTQTGRLPEAIINYRAALERSPANPDILIDLANTLAQAGEMRDAISVYERALKLRPNDPDAHYNLALVFLQEGDRGRALIHCRETLRIDPGFAKARTLLQRLGP